MVAVGLASTEGGYGVAIQGMVMGALVAKTDAAVTAVRSAAVNDAARGWQQWLTDWRWPHSR